MDGKLTPWQRAAKRDLARKARKKPGEPLTEEDWTAYFEYGATPVHRRGKKLLAAIPSSPRCGFCGAPFAGAGGRMLRPLGYRPSRKNPNVCDVCIEMAPPGGMTTTAGVLFADVRGFTALAERAGPRECGRLLGRFYATAENVLFPEAIIDKLIGDSVMALYLAAFIRIPDGSRGRQVVAPMMLTHARRLLEGVGYGSPEGPFLEIGIGLDYGEAFVGNIGDGGVRDFTAIGDVVNTASRLEGEARSGEIVLSDRLLGGLAVAPGEAVSLTVKGKAEPVAAHRIAAAQPSETT